MTKLQFSARLKELRAAKKITQVQISRDIKMNLNLYEFYENANNSRIPTYKNLIKLANYFTCSIDYLLCQTDNLERNY